jgi:hypothetical protein
VTDERFDLQAVEYDRRRAALPPPPARYGTPPVAEYAARTGDCPVCWTETELNIAGRIRPHGGCAGAGDLPMLEPDLHPYWLTGGTKEDNE